MDPLSKKKQQNSEGLSSYKNIEQNIKDSGSLGFMYSAGQKFRTFNAMNFL